LRQWDTQREEKNKTNKRKLNGKTIRENVKNENKNGGNLMLRKWFKDEEGQGMVEYGLIIGLIAVVVIVALVALGPKVRTMFEKVNTELDKAGAGAAAGAGTGGTTT